MERIQRKRTKGWRMPEGAVYVGRPTRWGNPWVLRQMRDIWPGHVAHLRDPGAWMVTLVSKFGTARGPTLGGSRDKREAAALSVMMFRRVVEAWHQEPDGPLNMDRYLAPLRDAAALACWCPLDQPCHADVLIDLLTTT